MKVAVLQLNPKENLGQNLRKAARLLETAAKSGAQVACLPEMFAWQGPGSERSRHANLLNEGVFAWIGARAKELQLYIVGGSHMEKVEGQAKMYNTCIVSAPDGSRRGIYRKQRLFQLAGQHDETISYIEGNKPGNVTINVNDNTYLCQLAICFDLRFPEVMRHGRQPDIIFLPSAFTMETGRAHWLTLIKARAIENQCFVVAANQCGSYLNGKKQSFGHSTVVDPWGRVLGNLKHNPGILLIELKYSLLAESRMRLDSWPRN
jgi:predicted amidohydrolase